MRRCSPSADQERPRPQAHLNTSAGEQTIRNLTEKAVTVGDIIWNVEGGKDTCCNKLNCLNAVALLKVCVLRYNAWLTWLRCNALIRKGRNILLRLRYSVVTQLPRWTCFHLWFSDGCGCCKAFKKKRLRRIVSEYVSKVTETK